MINYETVFDDLVVEENGKWTQVCDECSKKHSELGILEEIPIADLICGIKGCENEAFYYLDLKK
jgi:hypothetical protein